MDGDAFFVGVEVAKNPALRGLPVVTGEERGIATALSYEAKALGVTRGMPVFMIKKQFPQVTILPGDYKSYVQYSKKMFDIVRRYVDDVEEYSIDECFADMTGWDTPQHMTYFEMAETIQQVIEKELDISVSIGVAPTKVLAKVASKWKKPHGITQITSETIPDFLTQIGIEKIWGVGPQTALKLHKKGIKLASDFTAKPAAWVHDTLAKPYEIIWKELRGESVLQVDPYAKTKYASIQKTRSFHPATSDTVFLLSQLSKHIEDACAKTRRYKLVPRKLSIYLKTKTFTYLKVTLPLTHPTSSPETLITLMRSAFPELYHAGILYRATGVTLHELIPDTSAQSDLFGETVQLSKFKALHKDIDALEEKLGKRMVHLASTQSALNRKTIGTDADDLESDLLFL